MTLEKQPYRKLMKLEAMRGVSALYVFIHHYAHVIPELASISKFFIFGQFALMVFFILSGFVIYYASVFRDPNITFWTYFQRRVRRIFPAFILVLLITYLLRSATSGMWLSFHWEEFIGNILQLQDKNPASIVAPYWQNSPLWSLAYEWWFYLFFFAIHLIAKKHPQKQKFIVIGMALTGFAAYWIWPNQFALFFGYLIMWWTGLEIAREWTETGQVTLRKQGLLWFSVLAMGFLWMVPAYLHYLENPVIVLADFPYVQPRHFITTFLVLCMGFTWHKMKWIFFNKIFKHFIFLAPLTYIIYIVHYPVVFFARITRLTGNIWLDFIGVCLVTFGIAWLIENPFQKWVNRNWRISRKRRK